MRYISTRGAAPALEFDDVLLTGLARDGGLYVPETWPRVSAEEWRAWRGLSYGELAFRVLRPFVGGRIDDRTLARLAREAYAGFGHRAVAPLKQLDHGLWLMELFHGPTLAFKDVAMQLLASVRLGLSDAVELEEVRGAAGLDGQACDDHHFVPLGDVASFDQQAVHRVQHLFRRQNGRCMQWDDRAGESQPP